MPTTKKTTPKKVVKKSVAKPAPAKKVVKKTTPKKVVKKTSTKTISKKVVKKSAAKNLSKKTTAKTQPKKILVLAPDDKSFWVTNGEVLNSLIALRDALNEMEKEVYSYHVSKEHNDFANWVDAVLCDTECAAELKHAHTPVKAKSVVTRRLKVYSV